MLVCFHALQRNCINTQCPYQLLLPCICHLWHAWIIIGKKLYFSMNLFSSFMFVCRKSILYIPKDIKFPSLPVSILFSHASNFWLLFILSLLLTWYHGNWKLLIVPCQIPVLLPFCSHCLGVRLELPHVFCHHLVPVSSGSYSKLFRFSHTEQFLSSATSSRLRKIFKSCHTKISFKKNK